MINRTVNSPRLLTCCLPPFPGSVGRAIRITDSATGHEALWLLAVNAFDLLLCGERIADMPLQTLIRRLREEYPWQKWALVGSGLSEADEIFARAQGSVAVLDTPPDPESLLKLLEALRGRWGTPAAVGSPAARRQYRIDEARFRSLAGGGSDLT